MTERLWRCRREAKDRAVSSKMTRMHAILGGESYLNRSPSVRVSPSTARGRTPP